MLLFTSNSREGGSQLSSWAPTLNYRSPGTLGQTPVIGSLAAVLPFPLSYKYLGPKEGIRKGGQILGWDRSQREVEDTKD